MPLNNKEFTEVEMQIKQYLAEAEKQYHLRLKTIVPLDDAAMDRIEMTVAKYLPLFISKPKKTIIQRQPLEFPNVQNAEIYIVDLSFALPAAPHVIRDDIRKALSTTDEMVFVRNQAEPGELETERLNALADIEAEAMLKGLQRVGVLGDPDYNEADGMDNSAMFGNAYNTAFLSYLSAVQKERADRVIKVANAPFKWLALKNDLSSEQDVADFNADVAGAPKVAPQGIVSPPVNRSTLGHFEIGNGNEVRRMYKDENGNRVVLARKLFGESE
jgi:hypothetical protein